MKVRRLDFVNVRLTAAGEKMLKGAESLTFQNRHLHYTFRPGVAQEVVLRYEWRQVLSRELFEGEPVFEAVEEEVGESPAGSTEPDEQVVTLEGDTDGSV